MGRGAGCRLQGTGPGQESERATGEKTSGKETDYGHREIGDPEYQGDVEREFKDLYSATVMFWPVSGLLYGSRAADAAWEKHDPYRVQKLEARIAELEKMTRTGSM